MKRFWQIILVVALCLVAVSAWSQDQDCISRGDLDRVSTKEGIAHDIVWVAKIFFSQHGQCPSANYIGEELKLGLQHPEMFGGALRIYTMDSVYGVPQEMNAVERDHYIFYYGDDISGLVVVEIFDSQSDYHLQLSISDSDNIAQSIATEYHNILNKLENFADELAYDGSAGEIIEKYIQQLAFGPDEASTLKLKAVFRRNLVSLWLELENGDADIESYAVELSYFKIAVWEEHRVLRDKRLERQLKQQ